MALLFMDSFDHYVTADIAEKWTSTNGMSIVAAIGRRGSAGLRGTTGGSSVSKGLPISGTTVIVGVATKFANTGTSGYAFMIGDASVTHIAVGLAADGSVKVYRLTQGIPGWLSGSSTVELCTSAAGAVSVGTVVYLELKVVIGDTGSVVLRLNGATVASASPVDTRQGGTGLPTLVYLGGAHDQDDLYVLDGSGAAPWNDFLGDCRVDARYPTAAGATTGWTPSAGANWQCTDDTAPNDDTDYTSAAAAGLTDTFVVQDAPVTGAAIYGVQHCLSAKKTDAGTASIAPVIRHSGVDYVGANLNPGTAYAVLQQIAAVNPGTSAAWTEAGFNAAEFGYKRTAEHMATSYANSEGTGNRTATITVTATGFVGAAPSILVDGDKTTNNGFFSSLTLLTFQFLSARVIDEAKFYQQNTATHGTWKWQGSNNGSTWTDIGGSFTLGGATVQTQTTLAGNVTAYAYYRLTIVSGASSSSPFTYEFEFKIDPLPPAAEARVTQAAVEVLGSSVAVFTTEARVTQDTIELISRPSPTVLVTQAAIEVLWGVGRWKLVIDGIDRTAIVEAVSITWTLNDRGRAHVVIADELPDRYAEVVAYAPDGITPLFGGLILQRQYAGRTQAGATFTAELECGDWFTYADWALTSASYAVDVTLFTVLEDLIADHLGAYGITLDPAQVAGPILAPFTWVTTRVSDALRELSDRTGYVVRISAGKALRMFEPMTVNAPFSMTEAATNCRDVTWRDSDRTPYNAVTLICGPGGLSEVDEERHNGDGVTRRWKLYAPFSQIIGGLITGNDATGNDPGGYNVGIFGENDIPWTVDLATNELVQRADQPIRAVGDYQLIWYTASFPFTVRVTSGATPVVEYAETRPEVRSEPVALEIANGLLASFQAAPRELTITTDVDGLDPGQALTVDLPTLRGVSGAFLVTTVSLAIAFDRVEARLWRYAVEAVESALYQGSYLDGWRKMAGAGGGGGSSGSVTAGAPAGPILAASSLLGRGASGAGAAEEISLSNSLIMTGSTLTIRTGIFDYAFNDALVEPPSAGQIRLNAAFPWTAASKAWVRFVSSDDQDLYWGIMIIPVGATLIVQDKDDHTRYGRFTTTGVPIDKGLYAEVPIAYVAHGTVITTAQRVFLRAVAT